MIPTDDGGKLDSLEITIANRGSNAKKQAVSLGRKGIGMQSVKNMMEKMNGTCTVKQEGQQFRVKILFPFYGV